MSTTTFVILGIGSVLILILSIPSLRAGWKHALPRSLAFVTLLVLALLNGKAWLVDPFSPTQLLAWLLLAASILLSLYPLYLLRRYALPEGNIDYTTRLVDRGIYRFIRHPLYLSLILLALGALLKRVTLLTLSLTFVLVTLLYITARLEESFNVSKFGSTYREYMQRTKMFIPWIL